MRRSREGQGLQQGFFAGLRRSGLSSVMSAGPRGADAAPPSARRPWRASAFSSRRALSSAAGRARRASGVRGLTRKSSMPAARQARRSSSKASAVRRHDRASSTPLARRRLGRPRCRTGRACACPSGSGRSGRAARAASGLAAAGDAVDLAALALQQGAGQQGVDGVVLGQQHIGRRAPRPGRCGRPRRRGAAWPSGRRWAASDALATRRRGAGLDQIAGEAGGAVSSGMWPRSLGRQQPRRRGGRLSAARRRPRQGARRAAARRRRRGDGGLGDGRDRPAAGRRWPRPGARAASRTIGVGRGDGRRSRPVEGLVVGAPRCADSNARPRTRSRPPPQRRRRRRPRRPWRWPGAATMARPRPAPPSCAPVRRDRPGRRPRRSRPRPASGDARPGVARRRARCRRWRRPFGARAPPAPPPRSVNLMALPA